jgi:O-antigen biosynthesis protein
MELRTKLIDIDLENPPDSIEGFEEYAFLQVLVRLHHSPVGTVRVPLQNGSCPVERLLKIILSKLEYHILRHLLCDWLTALPSLDRVFPGDVIHSSHTGIPDDRRLGVTVAICTRNRKDDLKNCLDSLMKLDYPDPDILVIDNAPADEGARLLIEMDYPKVRYVREKRPGLNFARNRAIVESKKEIITFIDDDAVADEDWISKIVTLFASHPGIDAVTGVVLPYELETEAQHLFERCGGFGRGFVRRWYTGCSGSRPLASVHGGAGKFGTGANMAFRRDVFARIGLFDPALDVGTVTNGGGDLDIFFRILKEGFSLVYEPEAVVRHRHRRDYEDLHTQIRNWGIGFSSYLVRNALVYHGERRAILSLWMWWIKNKFRSLLKASFHPDPMRDLMLAEFRGLFIGTTRYPQARNASRRINELFLPLQIEESHATVAGKKVGKVAAVRTIDLAVPLEPQKGLYDYASLILLVTWKGHPTGTCEMPVCGDTVGTMQLREAIAEKLYLRLLDPEFCSNPGTILFHLRGQLEERFGAGEGNMPVVPSKAVPTKNVSVVIATYDRPEDLSRCLRSLRSQKSIHNVEVVVVDNNPSSGKTPPVMKEFPDVLFIEEKRKGLSYARNRGIAASSGEIIVTTDDDVTVPPQWLDKLIAPFDRSDIMAVTGNVLPVEIETEAQQLFEEYGGLSRGFEPLEADSQWFLKDKRKAVPTWRLGSTANAAFRISLFRDPSIGLLDESLGAGTPTGCSEDTYLFYRILKTGHTILYNPAAYVWHRHRMSMNALRRQIYNYSKGHVAYHLKVLILERDLRAAVRLFIELPHYHFRRIGSWLRGGSRYPIKLELTEMAGHFVGPIALCGSLLRVRRNGRSLFIESGENISPVLGLENVLTESPVHSKTGK